MAYKGPDFYDNARVFEIYTARRARPESANNTLEKPVFDELTGDLADLRILDLGCGDAQFGREALQKGCRSYLGVEASRNMVALAQQTLAGSGGEVVRASLEAWDYPSAAFDLVTSRMVLHYVEDITLLFKRVFSALAPGGRFVFSIEHPVITSSDQVWQGRGQRQHWIVDNYFHTGPRTVSWLGDEVVKVHRTIEDYFLALKEAGFAVDAMRESRPQRQLFTDEETTSGACASHSCCSLLHLFSKISASRTEILTMVYVVGHRGAAKVLPENTLKGFRYAIDLGVDMMECDVHLTRDNHLVVMHDDTVDRTTNGTGAIRTLDFATIRGLDAGDGEQVPTLDEVLEVMKGKVPLLCELKGEGVEKAAVETVRRHKMDQEVIFTSFHLDRLARVRAMGPQYQLGAILPDPTQEDIKAAVALGCIGAGVHYKNLCLRIVEQVKNAGLDLRAWNPDTLPEMQAMIALGADGVSTNRPDILIAYLKTQTADEHG